MCTARRKWWVTRGTYLNFKYRSLLAVLTGCITTVLQFQLSVMRNMKKSIAAYCHMKVFSMHLQQKGKNE